MTEFPWQPGSATGIGSLPGTDIADAIATVFDELPDLPYLPELPARGPGADMIGRGAGLLVAMPVELYAGRWRIAAHPGLDARRTRDLWRRDLDALTDFADAYDGVLKIQVAGPWTLSASLDLPIGGLLLRDAGAARDLAASLAEGVAAHVQDVRARVPRATVLLQIDEPSLPAVLAGEVPTESGFSRLRAVETDLARGALGSVIEAAGAPAIVHCCAPRPPLELMRQAGAVGVAVDLDQIKDLDPIGELLEAGVGLFAGVESTSAPEVAARIRDLWRTIGFSINDLPAQVVTTPACGLAGFGTAAARDAMKVAREAGRRLADD
ncbi:MAG TPA: methionine synthase [Micromonosporaceae bacterium]